MAVPGPLETEAALVAAPTRPAPARWKSICVSFLVVYPTVQILTRIVAPRLTFVPAVLRDVLVVALMCVVLSYAIPLFTRWLGRWLRS